LVGNFVFLVFIQNKLVATYAEIKVTACLFPAFGKQRAENAFLAFKNVSMALFIGAESFPCLAFQENKYVVWSGNHLAIDSAAKDEWQR
jgi:hypothetical protein